MRQRIPDYFTEHNLVVEATIMAKPVDIKIIFTNRSKRFFLVENRQNECSWINKSLFDKRQSWLSSYCYSVYFDKKNQHIKYTKIIGLKHKMCWLGEPCEWVHCRNYPIPGRKRCYDCLRNS